MLTVSTTSGMRWNI